eukprot:m.66942 g.66942  ORF g.66942 m.66942 type:complete len:334 (+) comp16597_c1_seq2:104-1105(+)
MATAPNAAPVAQSQPAVRQTPLTCSGHTRPVVDLQFSPITPDGFFLISACKDGKPMLRNGVTGDWLGTFEGHKGAVWGVALDNTAEHAATASADFTAKIWDAVSGEEQHTFSHPHIVKAVSFDAPRTTLITGCNDKTIRVFDLQNYDSGARELKGHTASIKKIVPGQTPQLFLSASDDKSVRVWDVRSNAEVAALKLDAAVTNLEANTEKKVLTVTFGSTIAFYSLDDLKEIKKLEVGSPVHAASLHPNEHTFAWGGQDNMLHVVDYTTCVQSDEYKGHFGPIHCLQYSPDGQTYASGSEDGTVRLWQVHVGQEYGLWRFAKSDEAEAAADTA